MRELKALILSGGKSSRMGQDKGLMIYEGKTWVELAARKIQNLGVDFYVSVNEGQVEDYSHLFYSGTLIRDNIEAVEGPMKGILSAHKFFPNADWLVLTCDMVLLSEAKVKELILAYKEYPDFYSYIFNTDREQPFPGIYSTRLLMQAFNFIMIGKLKSSRMKDLLGLEAAFLINQQEDLLLCFTNINSKSDLVLAGLK